MKAKIKPGFDRVKGINTLKKFYTPDDTPGTPLSNSPAYLDNTNCVAFIPKTEEVKSFFTQSFKVSETNTPDLNYKGNSAKFSRDYLIKALEIIKLLPGDDDVILSILPDYPLTISTELYRVILAPRINSEEPINYDIDVLGRVKEPLGAN